MCGSVSSTPRTKSSERFSVASDFLCVLVYSQNDKKREREKEENDMTLRGPVFELTLRLAHVSFERKRAAGEFCLPIFFSRYF